MADRNTAIVLGLGLLGAGAAAWWLLNKAPGGDGGGGGPRAPLFQLTGQAQFFATSAAPVGFFQPALRAAASVFATSA